MKKSLKLTSSGIGILFAIGFGFFTSLNNEAPLYNFACILALIALIFLDLKIEKNTVYKNNFLNFIFMGLICSLCFVIVYYILFFPLTNDIGDAIIFGFFVGVGRYLYLRYGKSTIES